jgi:hypothetical protein
MLLFYFFGFMFSLIVSWKVPNIKDRPASATMNMISVSALGSTSTVGRAAATPAMHRGENILNLTEQKK